MARHSTMVSQVCRLHPHPSTQAPPLAISAEMIWRENGALTLSYVVLPLESTEKLCLPEQLIGPWLEGRPLGQRRDSLWEHTCFEAFLGLPDDPAYWELNVSPSGDWNLYRFSDYRQREAEQSLGSAPDVTLQPVGRGVRCSVEVDSCGFWPGSLVPAIGLTMVVEHTPGDLSFWALSHPGEQADFHDRRSFLVP